MPHNIVLGPVNRCRQLWFVVDIHAAVGFRGCCFINHPRAYPARRLINRTRPPISGLAFFFHRWAGYIYPPRPAYLSSNSNLQFQQLLEKRPLQLPYRSKDVAMPVSTEEMHLKERVIPRISLRNFNDRKDEIATQILYAAENNGFFILEDQESPSITEINDMFAVS